MKTSAETINEQRNTVIELVNEIIYSLNGENVDDTTQAYRIAGLCRILEGLTDGIPEKGYDATDLFNQSFNRAVQNGLVESIGWWDIIGTEIINYYREIGEFDDEDVNDLMDFQKEISDEWHSLNK